jgi:hypothetical protein
VTTGRRPPLVKAGNWLTHIEFDWTSLVWRHWIAELSRHYALVRYDERGCGLSDWNAADLSFQAPERLSRSGDVGNRMIGERQASVHWLGLGTQWRTPLRHLWRPPSQVLEDPPDDSRILDQRNDAHRPLAFGVLQRIGLVP